MVIHDLRGPATSIQMGSDIVLKNIKETAQMYKGHRSNAMKGAAYKEKRASTCLAKQGQKYNFKSALEIKKETKAMS